MVNNFFSQNSQITEKNIFYRIRFIEYFNKAYLAVRPTVMVYFLLKIQENYKLVIFLCFFGLVNVPLSITVKSMIPQVVNKLVKHCGGRGCPTAFAHRRAASQK